MRRLKDDTYEKLKNAKEVLLNMVSVIDDVLMGTPINKACRNHDVVVSSFRNLFICKGLYRNTDCGDIDDIVLSSYDRLYCAITNESDITKIPYDVDKTIPLALSMVPENLQKIIEYRFIDRLTLEESGVKLGVTKERARQLETKALCMLRRNRYFYLIKYGRERYDKDMGVRKKNTAFCRNCSMNEDNSFIRHDTLIDELGFSNGTKLWLYKNRCYSLGDILKHSKEDFQTMPESTDTMVVELEERLFNYNLILN